MWTNRKSKIRHAWIFTAQWLIYVQGKNYNLLKAADSCWRKKEAGVGKTSRERENVYFRTLHKKNSLVLIIEIGSDELEHILGYIFQPVPWSTNARGEKSQNCALTFCWPKKKLIVAENCLLILLVLKR